MYQPKKVSGRMQTPIEKESVLTFGKHKGKTVGEVLICDSSYLVWCMENLDWFDVDTGLQDEIYTRFAEDDLFSQYALPPDLID